MSATADAPRPTGASKTVPENANDNCVGTESAEAGKADACQGCPNQTACAEVPKGPDPDVGAIADRLASVKKKILILSGKGGVGKSTVSATLAHALAAYDHLQIGLLDIDICGPSIPKIMGLDKASVQPSATGWVPAYVDDNLAVMSVGFMLKSENDAVIWRGPKKNGLIKQFLKDVDWGALDYLLIDTPPGTSDEHLSIAQYLRATDGVEGAIIVTTPQEVALLDVRKEINFCRKVKLPVLGVIENMSGFVCPGCNHETQIFRPTTGGAEQMAKDFGIPFLGRIPIDPALRRACDSGASYLSQVSSSEPTVAAFSSIVRTLWPTLPAEQEAKVKALAAENNAAAASAAQIHSPTSISIPGFGSFMSS